MISSKIHYVETFIWYILLMTVSYQKLDWRKLVSFCLVHILSCAIASCVCEVFVDVGPQVFGMRHNPFSA